MFFFFAAVNQQVRQVLEQNAGRCLNCGSKSNLVEYENVLKLFFVPVYKWPGKEPRMHCQNQNCSLLFPTMMMTSDSDDVDVLRCRSCARIVDHKFNYCPYCGIDL